MRGNTLTAPEGQVYTDGCYFGQTVYLRQGDDGSAWQLISMEEAELLEEAAAADYRAALKKLGVQV